MECRLILTNETWDSDCCKEGGEADCCKERLTVTAEGGETRTTSEAEGVRSRLRARLKG